jgi:hypothetical protein
MAAAFTNLHRALREAAVEALGASFPLALENAPFEKPEDNSPWAALFFLDNAPSPATLGDDGEDAHDGVMQIDLNYEKLKGEVAVDTKADTITGFFKAGRAVSYGGVTATVVSCGRSKGREVDGWWRVSMSVTWRARVPR